MFSTNGNATTRDNIANVYGAKTLSALIPLDLKFDMQPKRSVFTLKGQKAGSSDGREIKLVGHVSRPVVGGGRATPDRQMFFVNSRPCNLPQVARAVNEVYKSFNVTQSPFIFLNLLLDTTSYDVNVSPDKMTILLHDESGLIEPLKSCLTDLYELQSQSVPLSQVTTQRRLVTQRSDSSDVVDFLPFEGSRNQQKPSESSIITSPSSETQSDGKDSHKTQVDSAASLPAEKISTEFVNARQFMERSTDSSGYFDSLYLSRLPATNHFVVSTEQAYHQ